MEDILFKHYERLLRLGSDWSVIKIVVDDTHDNLHIYICYNKDYWVDSTTGEVFKLFDFRTERVWRHLDSMEHSTLIHCRLPRVKTSEGRCITVPAKWADAGFSYTKKFENKCISALQATHCQKSASKLLGITDDTMCGIMHKSVERGLSVRDLSSIDHVSLDEKSFAQGHVYMSVLSDARTGTILDVERDRTEQAATTLLNKAFNTDELLQMKGACCDMWDAFTNALKKTVRMPSWYTTSFMLSNT
jgi:transposase